MSGYSPAIVDGKIVRLSVSQLSRFDTREHGGCPRKYWFKYIGRVPEPEQKYFQDGKDGHKRFEDYYNGKEVVWLDMDLPALEHLPKPGPGVEAESRLQKLSCLRIPLQGSMDLVHGRDVYDYKFQSKIRVYSEPTAQLWGYLEEVRLRDNSGGRLSFHHVYIEKPPKDPVKALTWKPKAKKVSQHFEPREVERQWLTYGSLVREMQDVAAEPDVSKVEANTNACFAYGPCPYLGICPKHKEDEIMGFMEELAALKNANAPTVMLPEVNAEIKALPPDAPPPDAVPTAPESAPAQEKPKRAKKEKPTPPILDKPPPPVATMEIPDSSPSYAPKAATPAPKLKALRLGLTVGLPNYSSASAFVEMEGGTEEELTKAIETMITRKLERVSVAFIEAMKAQEKALTEALEKVRAAQRNGK